MNNNVFRMENDHRKVTYCSEDDIEFTIVEEISLQMLKHR